MYIEVILPVPLADTFTYFVPAELEARVVCGGLVEVIFGHKKYYGIVASIGGKSSVDAAVIKPIVAVPDAPPAVDARQLQFWEWLAGYYLCRQGEVFKAALPPAFIEKGLLHSFKKRNLRGLSSLRNLSCLNSLQEQALLEIKACLQDKNVCLLHGVTSSGKTEIYTHLIQETLDAGRQVLYLLPEIALTTQITGRLRQFFGERLGVYHSQINHHERKEIWEAVTSYQLPVTSYQLPITNYHIILGARSAVFLPFRNLGLVIVDEEHEPSYKQQDPAPRYHARNAAIMLASMHGAKVVLGSATPSVESFYNAQTGKYGYVHLEKRFEDTELPRIIPVDVQELRRTKQMKSIFSPLLQEAMRAALDKGEQVLLFQNRRGFAPVISCKICDWTPKCRFCDISLTYHKQSNRLKCHYCGHAYTLPTQCPECGGELGFVGYGTEKVEEEIRALFSTAAVERMDTDTTSTKKAFEDIIARLESGQTQILIGTQMISKGLDFEKVGLVGILNADALMNHPDFRAYERAYQLMSQVSGRAGRRKERGEVILQTSHIDHALIQSVLQQNYTEMYTTQMQERELFRYPPLFRLIHITLKHRLDDTVRDLSEAFAAQLREKLGDRVLGPDRPAVGKIQNLYLRQIVLKIENKVSMTVLREILEAIQANLWGQKPFRYAIVQYDVDPV
ncbi:replication restart helicase PriA [Candidatus Symbiothrix dinenymphae]|uniref:replication restart helicase PriA n=1 Tax=Candidatus Symbiothrix dinenymphae TaxID=467085 RepID=UPI0006C27852|nr:primosomal protein N' [Candidatus Symbiothrix dinenymphae]GAP72588.1 helicase PriA essential for oriC [Candidatus Symbiothrix dinenymphae]